MPDDIPMTVERAAKWLRAQLCRDFAGKSCHDGGDCACTMQVKIAALIEDLADARTEIERKDKALERAFKYTWRMVDPLRPPGEPGSYARGEYNGIIAAIKALRDEFDRAEFGAAARAASGETGTKA